MHSFPIRFTAKPRHVKKPPYADILLCMEHGRRLKMWLVKVLLWVSFQGWADR
jgi:hypothetical protein